MNFTTKKVLLAIAAILYFLALLAFNDFFISTPIGNSIAILFILIYFVCALIWFRCPHCNAYLWKLVPFAKYCPRCGNQLND